MQRMPEPIRKVLLRSFKGGTKLDSLVRERLHWYGVEQVTDPESAQAVLVLGSDRDLLETLQTMGDRPLPLLHMSPPGYTTFFSSLEWEKLNEGLGTVVKGNYELEEVMRLKVVVDEDSTFFSLNEVGLFSSKSAVLLDYLLVINGESVWRDVSDGVIVATPTGSTAYALSAGGPMIMRNSRVLEIVPVNSVNPLRKTLVLPDDSVIEIREVASKVGCEIVVDGVVRHRVKSEVTMTKAERGVTFIRLGRRLTDSIERKAKITMELAEMPPSAKFVYKVLEMQGEASTKELARLTGLSERTVRYALSILAEKGLVERAVNIRDPRSRVYISLPKRGS